MDAPTMMDPIQVSDDITALPSYLPLPGLGALAVNAFVLKADQPLLVDTGLAGLRADFMTRLREVIDPAELRWIWITHTDADHVGNLAAVLAEAPDARVVTTFLGMGKMNLLGLPTERAYLLNPGQRLDVGDRTLLALAPPTYDAPETTGLFDSRSRALFSADSFGALLAEPVDNAALVPGERLREGLVTWAGIDAPWLRHIDRPAFAATLAKVRELDARHLLSAHLPPVHGMTDILCTWLSQACDAAPFDAPDQAALEAMMSAQAAA